MAHLLLLREHAYAFLNMRDINTTVLMQHIKRTFFV